MDGPVSSLFGLLHIEEGNEEEGEAEEGEKGEGEVAVTRPAEAVVSAQPTPGTTSLW